MSEHVVFFTPYPFAAGQRIHITAGPRRGDWEVISVEEKKVTLRCPVSGTTVKWDRFCYFAEEKPSPWPAGD